MKKQDENVENVQGTETTEKKQQKVSATYTLRASGENVRKLHELKLISEEEKNLIIKILKEAVNKYIGGII